MTEAAPQSSEPDASAPARIEHAVVGEATRLAIFGRLDAAGTAAIWNDAMEAAVDARDLVVEASGVDYCDASGASLLLALRQRQQEDAGEFRLEGLREDFRELLALIEPSRDQPPEIPSAGEPFVIALGKATLELADDLRELVAFVGELTVMLGRALAAPATVRWRDAALVAERAGIGAIPIVVLIGFLLGLILSFQSAIPMKRFGAEIFVADLLGISMLRELGPLMASILLTARSGSAFAAELGTMTVNEEVDALETMGLERVRFLVVPRVLAAVAVVPTLTILMSASGLIGGAVVMNSLGFPMMTFFNRVVAATSAGDFAGGIAKAMIFGVIVAAIGCLRGLQTGKGADAVGLSTTSAVVSGIILIAVADGIFAVLFYVLEW